MRFLSSMLAALSLTPILASAQPAPEPAAVETSTGFSAQAGFEAFSLRDISRTLRPPDASPISWRGGGVAVAGHVERSGPRSAHLADIMAANAGGFTYVSPTRRADAPPADSAYRLDARYEYRRYLLRDLFVKGLDIGAGLQAIGTRAGFDRHITSALSTTTRISGGGLGVVAAARLRRWDRLHVTASWANGEIVSRLEAHHSASPEAIAPSGGGNWFTDTIVRADWRVAPSARVSMAWRRGFEGYSSNHYHYAASRQALTVGILYAR
jgi:hypothetical protein